VAKFALSRWFRRRNAGPWRIAMAVEEADQTPDVIPNQAAVIVRSAGFEKWLTFDCPCGTGHRVMLNLDGNRWPRWSIRTERPLTVWPSVDIETDPVRCHYVLSNGHVLWINDDRDRERINRFADGVRNVG
jgi:hypothetical protein